MLARLSRGGAKNRAGEYPLRVFPALHGEEHIGPHKEKEHGVRECAAKMLESTVSIALFRPDRLEITDLEAWSTLYRKPAHLQPVFRIRKSLI